MATNRFGEEDDRFAERFKEGHPRGGLFVNAAYLLIVLAIAFAASQLAGTVFGWILPADTIAETRGDLSRNFSYIYPIRGVITLLVFYLAAFVGASRLGYSLAYEYKMPMPSKNHNAQAIVALIVFELLCIIFIDFLPSWYLSGPVSALFGTFDPSDVYSTELEGSVEILSLWLTNYFGLQLAFEAVIAVGSFFVLKKGRRTGEENAFVARKKLLEDLQQS